MISALELTRREVLLLGAAAFTSSIARNVEAAQDSERHGVSAFGDLKYPADFEHFDYVNPNAPKGGVFSHVGATRIFNQNLLTFNSLNSFILRGDAAMGMELTFASLMARAEDEPDALYGLAARAVANIVRWTDLSFPDAARHHAGRNSHHASGRHATTFQPSYVAQCTFLRAAWPVPRKC
jgi:hypothetical protein